MAERDTRPQGVGINGVMPGGGTCVATGCGLPAVRHHLMCPECWARVPVGLRENAAFVVAQWFAGRATLGEVRAAQWACVDALATTREEHHE